MLICFIVCPVLKFAVIELIHLSLVQFLYQRLYLGNSVLVGEVFLFIILLLLLELGLDQ